MRAIVIGGTHSGCGKTTITLGIMAALVKKGLVVQPFKTGPDFIDSGLHNLVTGRTSRNLDLWMCGREYVESCLSRASAGTDIAVIEGVMGLFDGDLSTASLARVLGAPVILVVDGYGMAESAGPMVKGFQDWGSNDSRPGIIKGVIFNRVASERHYRRLCAGIRDIPVLGYLPRDLEFEIPHRHLGLVVAEEEPISSETFSKLAEVIAAHVDLDRLLELAVSSVGPISPIGPIRPINTNATNPVRIAVAMDKAFCFYYRDNLDLLEEAGAELVFFSPLADFRLPTEIDTVYLGGGYPELHVNQLAENSSMRASVKDWADSGGCLYAECGGLMYLSRAIHDFDGRPFPMAGVLPFDTVMTRGRARLGYREATLTHSCLLGLSGESMRGHEFHYSAIAQNNRTSLEPVYATRDGSGNPVGSEGVRYKNTVASYVHLHFGSNPSIARSIVETARKGRDS